MQLKMIEKKNAKSRVLVACSYYLKSFIVAVLLFTVSVSLFGLNVHATEGNASAGTVSASFLQYQTVGAQMFSTAQTPSLREFRAMPAYEIFERFSGAVFTIYISTDGVNFRGSGSGFIIHPNGHAVTAQHVLGAPFMRARMQNGAFYDIIGVHNYDITNDLALIQLEGSNFPFVELGDSASVRPGQEITVIGTSRGTFHNRIVSGMVTGFGNFTAGPHNVIDAIMTDASTYGGNSGGPVFDRTGGVIGVLVGGMYDVQLLGDGREIWIPTSINYVTPINRLNPGNTRNLNNLISLASFQASPVATVPVIDQATASHSHLVGYWVWNHGYYRFNIDGTGSRDWRGSAGLFEWHVDGEWLVITQRGQTERWLLRTPNHGTAIIQNSLFVRVENFAEAQAITIVRAELAGQWEWSGGTYYFDAAGTATSWRDWSISPDYFVWLATQDLIFVAPFDDGNFDQGVDIWSLSIHDVNNITIGGANMVRYGAQAPIIQNPSDIFVGRWWYDAWWSDLNFNIVFNADNTGFDDWVLEDGTYEYESFRWRISGNNLLLEFIDGSESWEFVIINNDRIRLIYGDFILTLYRLL